jgi:hypothetical protein
MIDFLVGFLAGALQMAIGIWLGAKMERQRWMKN